MNDNQTESPNAPTGAQGRNEASGDRVSEFRTEMQQLKLQGSSGSAERWMLVVGAILAIVGVVLAVMGAIQVINSGDSPADQRAFMASGSLLGLVLVVAGAALFVRYSLGRYMRFWLIRLVYEGRADTDRIVDAIERAASGSDNPR